MSKFSWLFAILIAVAAVPVGINAQATGTITGRVLDNATQSPVSGAQVLVVGTNLRSVTNAAGEYRLPGVPAGVVQLRATIIGYATVTRAVTVAANQTATANFALAQEALSLDALVVTGTAGATQQRTIGNAVSTIPAADIVSKAPVTTVTQLLQARTPGLTIMPPSGTPGTAASIRIRGTGSYLGGNSPVFYIDGIRMASGAQGGFGAGGQQTSALDAINPDDIESIEVIKGPAAATLYGADAAGGVIQIITKKGRIGQQSIAWSAKVEAGRSDFHLETPTNYALCTPVRISGTTFPGCAGIDPTLPAEQRLITSNPLREPGILRNGDYRSYTMSARGGGERYSFYAAGDRETDEGVFSNSYFNRTTGRANFFVSPSDKMDLTFGTQYTRSDTRLPNNDNSSWGWLRNAYRGTPGFFNPATSFRVNWAGLGPDEMALYDNQTRGERFITSATLNYKPFDWFQNRLVAGLDANDRLSTLFFPIDQSGRAPYGAINATGTINQYAPSTRTWTLNYSGTITNELPRDIQSNFSFGTQLNAYRFESLQGQGEGLTTNNVRLVSSANVTRAFEGFSEENSLGLFVQEQIGWRNRVFLTGALRSDDNSTFGSEFDYVLYPKLSASWVVSEEPFFDAAAGFVDQLKLRAAWGRAGNSPSAFSADQTYGVSTVMLDNGTLASAIRTSAFGNPNLKAETGTEFEMGLDATFLNQRLGVEASFYNQRTTDALISVPVAPSSGFTGSVLSNLGEISNRGFELGVNATPIQARNVVWDARVNFSTNRNEFVSFGGARDEPILQGYGGGAQRIQPGYPLGAYFGFQPLRNADGTLTLNAAGRPVLDTAATYIGPSIPTREASLSSTFTLFQHLRLYGFMDYKGGHYLFNMTRQTRAGDLVSFEVVNPNAAAEEIALLRFGGNFPFIEKADFVKLRELSATLSMPGTWSRRIGADDLSFTLAGRNLAIWSDYSGLDPEVNIEGPATFTRADYLSVPQMRRIVATVNVSF